MSDSIELFEPEGFIPIDLRPPNVTSLLSSPERPEEQTKKQLQYIKVLINLLLVNQ